MQAARKQARRALAGVGHAWFGRWLETVELYRASAGGGPDADVDRITLTSSDRWRPAL